MLAIFSCEEPADSRTWLVWQSCCNRLCSCLPRNHSNILPPLNCICCSGRTDTYSPPPTPTPLDPNPWLQGWSLIVVNKSASLATIKRMSTEEARGIKKKKKKRTSIYPRHMPISGWCIPGYSDWFRGGYGTVQVQSK